MRNRKHISAQRGVVLFIALIALVVMSLAAVALIRSVDTSNIIAGNLSFKQSATISADNGLEAAITWLSTNISNVGTTDATKGYYATCNTFDAVGDSTCAASNLITTQWIPGTNSTYALGTDIVDGVDLSKNKIEYIIQRMCTTSGPADSATCLYAGDIAQTGSQIIIPGPKCCPPPPVVPSTTYRVTAKVTGPKNTVSYIQAFIY